MAKYKKEEKFKDPATLPETRMALFKQIIKEDFSLIVYMGLLFTIFSLPVCAVFIIEYLLIGGLKELSLQTAFPIIFYGGLVSIPMMGIMYLGRGAIFDIYKKRCFGEGYIVVTAFFAAIKSNFGKYFLSGIITGISLFLLLTGGTYLLILPQSAAVKGIGLGALLLQFILFFNACEYSLLMQSIYILKPHELLKNGLSLSFSTFALGFVYFLVAVLVPFIVSYFSMFAAIFVFVAYLLIIEPIIMLSGGLYAFSVFDSFINKENYPELYRKGLKKSKENQNG